jgi:outer membrane protein OmpA-like peptidoglycan-associated protein
MNSSIKGLGRFLAGFGFAPLLFLSCHQVQVLPVNAPRNAGTRADLKTRTQSYVLGYFQGPSHKVECRDGIESLYISRGVLDTAVQVLAGGLFSTRLVEVRCVRPHLNIAALESGKIVRLQGVYFDSNSSRLQKDSYLLLDELVLYMAENPGIRIQMTGHTDLIGTPGGNLVLSVDRADSGKQYLISKGISGNRVIISGSGSTKPVVHAFDEDACALNRRLEIVAVKEARMEQEREIIVRKTPESLVTEKPDSVRVERIEMKDGKVIVGDIINQFPDKIIVRVNGQIININKKQIRRIQYGLQ